MSLSVLEQYLYLCQILRERDGSNMIPPVNGGHNEIIREMENSTLRYQMGNLKHMIRPAETDNNG